MEHDEGCEHHRQTQLMWGLLGDDKKVIPIVFPGELRKWAPLFQDIESRRVQRDTVGAQTLSTVFLGINHGWGGEDQWFETALQGTHDTIILDRYATYAEALAGHLDLLKRLTNGEELKD